MPPHPDLPLWRVTAAIAASGFAVMLMKIGLPTLAGLAGGSPAEIGLVAGAVAIAWPAFGLVAGFALDRFGRAPVFRLGLAFALAAAAALAFLVSGPGTAILLLCLFGLAVGLAEVMTETAGQAILPEIVAIADLPRANSLLQGTKTVAVTLAAPLALAALVDIAPAAVFLAAFALALASFVVLPQPARPHATQTVGLRGFFDGWRFLAGNAAHRGITVLLVAMSLSWGAWMTLIVTFTLSPDHLAAAPSTVGTVMSALGFGSLAGALLYGRVRKALGPRRTLLIDVVGTILFLAAPALGAPAWLVFATAFAAGFGGVTWAITIAAFQQADVPGQYLGRVVATYRWIGWSAFFLGASLSGSLAEVASLETAFAVFALPTMAGLIAFSQLVGSGVALESTASA